jgi:hypothetical protein
VTELAEGLSELYFSKLKTSMNPGVVLAQFYGAVMGLEVGRSEIIMFGKLVKMFGRSSVFFAIIDISRIETPKEFPYGLLHHICRTKLEKSTEQDLALTSMYSLERKITELEKEMAKIKRLDPEKTRKYLDGVDG